MSRKTYSLSAVAIAATASSSFSNADGAVAIAQDAAANATAQTEIAQPVEETVEIVPEQPIFVSEEVVQAIPEAEAAQRGAGGDRPGKGGLGLTRGRAAIRCDSSGLLW